MKVKPLRKKNNKRGRHEPFHTSKREYEANIHLYRLDRGLTIADLCRAAGTDPNTYYSACQGLSSPINKDGKFKPWAIGFMQVLKASAEELWPREICSIERSQELDLTDDQVIWFTISEHSLSKSSNPVDDVDGDINEFANNLIMSMHLILTPIREYVLRRRFLYGWTLRRIGDELGKKQERVRQIEARALRMIRFGLRVMTGSELLKHLRSDPIFELISKKRKKSFKP